MRSAALKTPVCKGGLAGATIKIVSPDRRRCGRFGVVSRRGVIRDIAVNCACTRENRQGITSRSFSACTRTIVAAKYVGSVA